MKLSELEHRLRQAEAQVAHCERVVEKQRELVDRLERQRLYSTDARRLLAEFEQLRAMHVADCHRMRRERDRLPSERIIEISTSGEIIPSASVAQIADNSAAYE